MTDTAVNPRPDAWRADAVRYRILWRLVPSVTHKLAGSMQPVSMLAGIFARQLQRPNLDIPAMTKQVVDMQQACKAAVTVRTDVMSWFQPSETKLTSIADEAAQCTWLLSAEFAIRGCSVDNLIADAPGLVPQSCIRTMFMATLFAILDNAEGPLGVELRTLPHGNNGATIVASWFPLAPSDLSPFASSENTIGWDDLQAVAAQSGVALQRTDAQIDFCFTLVA